MTKKNKLLDIDHLKSFGVDPAYFGLGFIQLKINNTNRLHFYHNDLPVLAEEPHTHRYSFTSRVLQGTFIQSLYRFKECPVGEYDFTNVSCDPNVKVDEEIIIPGELEWMMDSQHAAGTVYSISMDQLHSVWAEDNCITHLTRNEPKIDFPYVVVKRDVPRVCPFSEPIPVDRCWEMIEDMLPEPEPKKKKKKKFGYHVSDIPKGTVGEPSKILEEALEIMDAHEQGVRIMAMHEMSDLYGAMDRYREKYYPELTMQDIEDMYRVTRRAFDNGKRT